MIDGDLDGGLCRACVGQLLVKDLKPDDIVVMDNPSSHKVNIGML